jgi:hypothetical protein
MIRTSDQKLLNRQKIVVDNSGRNQSLHQICDEGRTYDSRAIWARSVKMPSQGDSASRIIRISKK